jgi:hypothetical protein
VISVVPSLLAFIVVGGLAVTLLAWPLSRRISQNRFSADHSVHAGAILADENSVNGSFIMNATAWLGAGESGTVMLGLLISSTAVCLICAVSYVFASLTRPFQVHAASFMTPFVLGVFGYWLVHLWMRDQRHKNIDALPTPKQYGLLVGLCAQYGIPNIFATATYALRRRNGRPNMPLVLMLAVCGTAFFVFINIALTCVRMLSSTGLIY